MSKRDEEILAQQQKEESEIRRIKIPKGLQSFGVLIRMLGGSRMEVKCFDGKTRICRIPGRLKRKLWVREGDVVIVEPWEYSGDAKGDIIFKYTRTQVNYLHNKGLLKKMEEFEEF